MPELPEVEWMRNGLTPLLVGQPIQAIEVLRPKIFATPPGWSPERVVGQTVRAIWRRAKFLGWDLSGDLALLWHFKLAGQLAYRGDDGTIFSGGHPVPPFDAPMPVRMTHVILRFPHGWLYANDVRQFMRVRLMPAAAVADFLASYHYGPDALDPALTVSVLAERLATRPRMALKPLLLDQTFIAGLGNIYSDEAANWARLHPLRRAGSLSPEEVARLHFGIREALRLALPCGGAAVLNGRALPAPGRDILYVHGRAGLPCRRGDGGVIERIIVGQRGTYFCPVCQPPPSPNEMAATTLAVPARSD
jgi:formamidopyrimidine-DNA glycosylase